jgi:hypothetical protein
MSVTKEKISKYVRQESRPDPIGQIGGEIPDIPGTFSKLALTIATELRLTVRYRIPSQGNLTAGDSKFPRCGRTIEDNRPS